MGATHGDPSTYPRTADVILFTTSSNGRAALEAFNRFGQEASLRDIPAVLLLDQNQVDAAKEYIDSAKKGPIFPEEKRLLEEARAKAAAAPSPPADVSPTPAISPTPSASPPPQP